MVDWVLAITSKHFSDFLKMFLSQLMRKLKHLSSGNNNLVVFHLLWKEIVPKRKKVYKCFAQVCVWNFKLLIERYAQIWFLRKNNFFITFCVWFFKKNVSHVMFYNWATFIVWLSLLLEILGRAMCVLQLLQVVKSTLPF